MRYQALTTWIGREWRRNATTWLLALGAASLGPLFVVTLPWAVVGNGALNESHLDSIWYLSTYFGLLAGLALLARAGTIWAELGAQPQAVFAGLWLLACSVAHGLLALLTLAALVPLEWPSLGALALCAAHWAALGTFVQRSGLGLGAKWILLSALGWWIPALLGDQPGWDRARWLLAPDRHFEVLISSTETSVRVLVDTIPIGAWWVAAALLPSRSAFRR